MEAQGEDSPLRDWGKGLPSAPRRRSDTLILGM